MWLENSTHWDFGMSYLTNPYMVSPSEQEFSNLVNDSSSNFGQCSGGAGSNMGYSFKIEAGSELIGITVQKLGLILSKDTGGSGTVRACLYDTNGTQINKFWEQDISGLTTSPTLVHSTTAVDSTATISENQYIGMHCVSNPSGNPKLARTNSSGTYSPYVQMYWDASDTSCPSIPLANNTFNSDASKQLCFYILGI